MDLNHRSRSAGLCVLSNRTPLEWLRGVDLNHRPLGYEPNELPDCSTPLFDTTQSSRDGQPIEVPFMSRVSAKPYFIYILWSSSGKRFYTGISEEPSHRLEQHNFGNLVGWRKRYRPWELVYEEKHANYTEAHKRELELKAQKGGTGFFAKTGLDRRRFRS